MMWILSVVAGLACLVCLIMVIIKMFQSGSTTLGIITIVLSFCGIGTIIALVWGWMNATRLNMKNLMMVYTIAFIVNWALTGYSISTGAFTTGLPAAP